MNALTFKRVGFTVAVLLSDVADNDWAQVQRFLLRTISIMALVL